MRVETIETEAVRSARDMLLTLVIPRNTRSMAHYERAKQRWGQLCLVEDEYEAGLKFIADWIGV